MTKGSERVSAPDDKFVFPGFSLYRLVCSLSLSHLRAVTAVLRYTVQRTGAVPASQCLESAHYSHTAIQPYSLALPSSKPTEISRSGLPTAWVPLPAANGSIILKCGNEKRIRVVRTGLIWLWIGTIGGSL
jgi:hypothetical protein